MREYRVVGFGGQQMTVYAKSMESAKDAAIKQLASWPTSVIHIPAPKMRPTFHKAKNGNIY